MKRAAIFAAAFALVLSLAACGNRDGNNNGGNGTANNTGTNGTLGTAGNNGSVGSGGANNGNTGSSLTGSAADDGGLGIGSNTGTTDSTRGNAAGRSIGGDVRGAVDDMGRAVDDLLDVGNSSRTAGMTSFQRMLDNARVHDADGVLTDGENSRW